MVKGLWGKKVGMTQVFVGEKVIPVTVIDASHWYVLNVRTQERDGHVAVQIGCPRGKYRAVPFSRDWIKQPNKFFSLIREIGLDDVGEVEVGQLLSVPSVVGQGDKVDVFGTTTGRGFAGVVRRHRFNGPPGSHGSKMGNRTGSLSFMRSQGRVIKGKRMPGHMGCAKRVMRHLEVVQVLPEESIVMVKGSVPGRAGSFLYVRKA